ncbi:hypothetical protein ANN_11657 [Periplaneta americana]|uniref:Uncharacterized protein n=1 Tax=Periplaneta americana TaxID=6978 RepID=A0ABQ8T717_PERAM|nr:hypothetical protein ANN_11657 [Periplaneta americana]
MAGLLTKHDSTSMVKSKVYANNPHSLEELKISGTKFKPFRRTNRGELLDMSSGSGANLYGPVGPKPTQ